MPKQEVLELRPTGWESDPLDQFFKLSTLDYCTAQVYTNYAIFFKISDDDKPKVIPVLKRGLDVTLSQCRPVRYPRRVPRWWVVLPQKYGQYCPVPRTVA